MCLSVVSAPKRIHPGVGRSSFCNCPCLGHTPSPWSSGDVRCVQGTRKHFAAKPNRTTSPGASKRGEEHAQLLNFSNQDTKQASSLTPSLSHTPQISFLRLP